MVPLTVRIVTLKSQEEWTPILNLSEKDRRRRRKEKGKEEGQMWEWVHEVLALHDQPGLHGVFEWSVGKLTPV